MAFVWMIVFSLVSLLFFLMLWMAFVPVLLLLDTDSKRYEVRQPGIFTIVFHPNELSKIKLRLFGLSIPIRTTSKGAVKSKTPVKKKKPQHKSFYSWMFLIKGCVKSFRLKRLIIDVDTGNAVINAQLIPVNYFFSRGCVNMQTNFVGRTYMHVEVEGRIYKILWTSIQFFLGKKIKIWK